MKKYNIVFVCIMISVLIFCACSNEHLDTNDSGLFAEFDTDVVTEIENILAEDYSYKELEQFFSKVSIDSLLAQNAEVITFDEVNKRFPVGILRNNHNYSVYKVKEGGLYYVFWGNLRQSQEPVVSDELAVCFTAYLRGNLEKVPFLNLKPGISTAKDVKMIDTSFELDLSTSSGIFSYSFLNKDEVVRIEYNLERTADDAFLIYENFVVKNIDIVPRVTSQSYFGEILEKDIFIQK